MSRRSARSQRLTAVLGGSLGLLVLMPASHASAHAELGRAQPAAGSHLQGAPDRVWLDFTESLAPDSRVRVVDGCRRLVMRTQSVRGTRLEATLRTGRPGTWQVLYDVASSDDGHASTGSYSFLVAGLSRCEVPTGAQVTAAHPTPTGTGWQASASLLGSVALVGAGLVVRRRTAPSR